MNGFWQLAFGFSCAQLIASSLIPSIKLNRTSHLLSQLLVLLWLGISLNCDEKKYFQQDFQVCWYFSLQMVGVPMINTDGREP
jgi:hypothetical protein